MRDHFPFWLPLVTTILIAGVFVAWDWSVVHIATVNFEGAARQERECRVVAELAKASLPEFEHVNIARTQDRLPPVAIGVDPRLWQHITREGEEVIFPARLPHGLHPLLLLVPSLDCTAAYRSKGVPIMKEHAPLWDEHGARAIKVVFSRIVFSADGREAYVERGSLCGGLCGEGFDTVWRLRDGKWILIRSRPTWVS